ncbi:MAG: head GIN domain-containing protein [Bacteroidota bacterium]
MKKNIVLFLFVAISMISADQLAAQKWWKSGVKGEGPSVRKTINLDKFDGFSLAVSGNVYIKQGNTQKVEVVGQENIIELLNRDVSDGYWKIKFDENVRNYNDFKVYITIPTLTRASISGSGDIESDGKFNSIGDLSVGISGSGNIKLAADANDVNVRISGSGNIKMGGSASNMEVRISGSGDVNCYEMPCENAEITISGSGDVKIHATEDLKVRSSGSGDVFYKGRPRVNSRSSGSGSVTSQS